MALVASTTVFAGGCIAWFPVAPGDLQPALRMAAALGSQSGLRGVSGVVPPRVAATNSIVPAHHVAAEQEKVEPTEEVPTPQPEGFRAAEGFDRELGSILETRIDIQPAAGAFPPNYSQELVGTQETIYYTSLTEERVLEYPVLVASPEFCHRPLYFEESALERYGQTHGLCTPLVSAARFYGNFPMLPYRMVVERPCDCVCTYGPYVPGDCGPCPRYVPPLQFGASLVEAGLITGLVFLIP